MLIDPIVDIYPITRVRSLRVSMMRLRAGKRSGFTEIISENQPISTHAVLYRDKESGEVLAYSTYRRESNLTYLAVVPTYYKGGRLLGVSKGQNPVVSYGDAEGVKARAEMEFLVRGCLSGAIAIRMTSGTNIPAELYGLMHANPNLICHVTHEGDSNWKIWTGRFTQVFEFNTSGKVAPTYLYGRKAAASLCRFQKALRE